MSDFAVKWLFLSFFEHKWPTIALQIEIWGGEIWFFSVCTCASEFFYNPRMTLKRGAIQNGFYCCAYFFFFFSIENIFLRETLLFRLSCRKLKKWVMGTRNNNHQLFPSDEVFFGNRYGCSIFFSRVWTLKNSKKGQNGDNHFGVV